MVEKNLSIFSSKKIPAGCLLGFIFISAIGAFLVYFDDYIYMSPYLGLRMKMKNEISQKSGNTYDILALGDCYNLVGIDPNMIYEETGLTGFNFATHAMETIIAAYCMFDNYIKFNEKKPEILILGFIPRNCAVTLETIKKVNIIHLYNFGKGNLDVYLKEFGWKHTVKFLIPTLKHQWIVENLILNPFSTRKPNLKKVDAFIKTVYADKGRHPWYVDDVYDKEITDLGEYNFSTVSPFFDRYLRRILDIAGEQGIQVIYNIPTVTPDRNRLYERYGNMKKYVTYYESLQKEYPKMVIVYPQNLLNEKTMYIDNFHLNGKGSKILNAFLSKKINELKNDIPHQEQVSSL